MIAINKKISGVVLATLVSLTAGCSSVMDVGVRLYQIDSGLQQFTQEYLFSLNRNESPVFQAYADQQEHADSPFKEIETGVYTYYRFFPDVKGDIVVKEDFEFRRNGSLGIALTISRLGRLTNSWVISGQYKQVGNVIEIVNPSGDFKLLSKDAILLNKARCVIQGYGHDQVSLACNDAGRIQNKTYRKNYTAQVEQNVGAFYDSTH